MDLDTLFLKDGVDPRPEPDFILIALFFNKTMPAKLFFALCLLSIIAALIIYLYEITLSTKALNYHLLDLDNMNKKK